MNVNTIKFVGQDDGPVWPELRDKPLVHLGDGTSIGVAVLDAGMKSGQPSIMLRLDLPDGRTVLAETSARLFCTTAQAIMARYPNLFRD